MTSNKSYSKTPLLAVLRTQLSSQWLLLILFGVLLFGLPLIFGFLILNPAYLNPDQNWNSYDNYYIDQQGRTMLFAGMLPLLVFALALAVGQFGYLHKRRKLDFYHAIPVCRTQLYLGRVLLSGAALVLGALLVVISQILVVAFQFLTITVGGNLLSDIYAAIWKTGAVMALYALAAYLFTVLIFVATATLWEAVFSFLVLSVAYPLASLIVVRIAESTFLLPDVSDNVLNLTLLSPFLTGFSILYDALWNALSVWAVPVLLAQILVCGAVSFWIFRRRPSERAESSAETWFRRVVRFCTAAVGAFLGSWILFFITDSYPVYLLGAVLGAAAAWVLVELLYVHSLRGLLKKLPASAAGLAVFAVVNVLIALGFGSLQLPTIEQIDAVTVYGGTQSNTASSTLTRVNGSMTVFTESGAHFVDSASFDDAIVEETYALLEEMLAYQRDTYFPYHPLQAMRLSEYVIMEKKEERCMLWITLYENGKTQRINFSSVMADSGIQAIYAHAKEIVDNPLYTQNNPELVMFDALEAIGDEMAGPARTRMLSDAEKEAVFAAYQADLESDASEEPYTSDDYTPRDYCLYFDGDKEITLQGGIVDDRYPAIGTKCTLEPQDRQEEYKENATLRFTERSFPNTAAALESIWAAHDMLD